MEYNFYGWKDANVLAVDTRFSGKTPRDLYNELSDVWCEYTCAPRLREKWSKENKTCGQCSITAFLMQDIFGGKVYGIKVKGATHCFNNVNGCIFDLTSEQFGDEAKNLDYENCEEQSRDIHFSKEEKKARYEYLKEDLIRRNENK